MLNGPPDLGSVTDMMLNSPRSAPPKSSPPQGKGLRKSKVKLIYYIRKKGLNFSFRLPPEGTSNSFPKISFHVWRPPFVPGAALPKAPAGGHSLKRSPPPNDLGGKAKDPEYEVGWSEEHMCAWRKLVKGPKLRGAVEYSLKPSFDSTIDENTCIQCHFEDGYTVEIPHITMVACLWR